MKKMFCLIFFASLIFFAGFRNVSANMQDVLNVSKSAFKATDDYSDIVNSHSYESAKNRLRVYRSISDRLRDFVVEYKPSKSEAECLALTRLVVLNRLLTLERVE